MGLETWLSSGFEQEVKTNLLPGNKVGLIPSFRYNKLFRELKNISIFISEQIIKSMKQASNWKVKEK